MVILAFFGLPFRSFSTSLTPFFLFSLRRIPICYLCFKVKRSEWHFVRSKRKLLNFLPLYNASHRRVLKLTTHLNRFAFLKHSGFVYRPIGLYLPFFAYSIAYLLSFFNRQTVRNIQIFFVEKVEFMHFDHFSLYKSRYL